MKNISIQSIQAIKTGRAENAEAGVGFDVGVTKAPLVAQSDLFDLTAGDTFTRQDAAMGYEAAKRAREAPNYRDGNHGADCGATVGKIAGMAHDGYARLIRPVHTTADGDGIYAVSVGRVQADQDTVGTLAAEAMSEAILVRMMIKTYAFP